MAKLIQLPSGNFVDPSAVVSVFIDVKYGKATIEVSLLCGRQLTAYVLKEEDAYTEKTRAIATQINEAISV